MLIPVDCLCVILASLLWSCHTLRGKADGGMEIDRYEVCMYVCARGGLCQLMRAAMKRIHSWKTEAAIKDGGSCSQPL